MSEKVCGEEQLGMMYLCSSSMSQCPQTKVTWLVKNISLVLILVLLGLLRTHPVVSSPVQVQHNTHQLRYCRFETTHKFYTVNDLFKSDISLDYFWIDKLRYSLFILYFLDVLMSWCPGQNTENRDRRMTKLNCS